MLDNHEENIDLPTYAKALAAVVTFVFYVFCIAIGYFLVNGEMSKSITLLLVLGFCLPVVVWAIVALIRKKHTGVEPDSREMAIPIFYGAIFLLIFDLTITFLPH